MRVVLAEDLYLLRDGLVRLLEAYGHEVVTAVGDGPATLRALTEQRPWRTPAASSKPLWQSRCADIIVLSRVSLSAPTRLAGPRAAVPAAVAHLLVERWEVSG